MFCGKCITKLIANDAAISVANQPPFFCREEELLSYLLLSSNHIDWGRRVRPVVLPHVCLCQDLGTSVICSVLVFPVSSCHEIWKLWHVQKVQELCFKTLSDSGKMPAGAVNFHLWLSNLLPFCFHKKILICCNFPDRPTQVNCLK